jgi:hypothetical protein
MKQTKETESLVIPRLIHFIWAGGYTPLPDINMETIATWAWKNTDFKICLWVDEKTSGTSFEEIQQKYQKDFAAAFNIVCEKNAQAVTEIPNVFQVKDIRHEGICARENDIVDYELDRVDPNYGASSDMLRVRILKLGGVYADSDVAPSKTPLSDLPEFSFCTIPVVYLNDISQVKNEDVEKMSTLAFLMNRSRLGNDAIICTPRNPLIIKLVDHIEEENYQLARIWRKHHEPSVLSAILNRAYGACNNIKALTISSTGPNALCHILEDSNLGELKINKDLLSMQCSKYIDGVEVVIKPMKRLNCQLVEPVVEVKPNTRFKAVNQGSWLNVSLDIQRFKSLDAIYENLFKTIRFEQTHFGVLRLADHLRLLRQVSPKFSEDADVACKKFIIQLALRDIVDGNRLTCVQLISLDALTYNFYKKHHLLEKTQLNDVVSSMIIFDCVTSAQFFNDKLFTDDMLENARFNPIWCGMVVDAFKRKEVKDIFVKLQVGVQFIDLLVTNQKTYGNIYPLEKLELYLSRCERIFLKAQPLVKVCEVENVNAHEFIGVIQGLRQRIAEIKDTSQLNDALERGAELFKINDFEGALAVYQLGLNGIERMTRINEDKTATVKYNIASCYIRLERADEAVPYLQECLNIRKRLFGDKDPIILKASDKLNELVAKLSSNQKKY